jgi:hypothetical protein
MAESMIQAGTPATPGGGSSYVVAAGGNPPQQQQYQQQQQQHQQQQQQEQEHQHQYQTASSSSNNGAQGLLRQGGSSTSMVTSDKFDSFQEGMKVLCNYVKGSRSEQVVDESDSASGYTPSSNPVNPLSFSCSNTTTPASTPTLIMTASRAQVSISSIFKLSFYVHRSQKRKNTPMT